MNCPKCNTELHCSCPSCHKPDRNEWFWEGGEIIGCPICNYKNHCDFWMSLEIEQAGDKLHNRS